MNVCADCWGKASHEAVVVQKLPTMRSWDFYVRLHAAHKRAATRG